MISETDRLQVDLYWPRDGGWGGSTVVPTLEAAAIEVAKLRRGGYGGPNTHNPSIIQVRRIRVDLIPLEDLPKIAEVE